MPPEPNAITAADTCIRSGSTRQPLRKPPPHDLYRAGRVEVDGGLLQFLQGFYEGSWRAALFRRFGRPRICCDVHRSGSPAQKRISCTSVEGRLRRIYIVWRAMIAVAGLRRRHRGLQCSWRPEDVCSWHQPVKEDSCGSHPRILRAAVGLEEILFSGLWIRGLDGFLAHCLQGLLPFLGAAHSTGVVHEERRQILGAVDLFIGFLSFLGI